MTGAADNPVFTAAVDLLRRTGQRSFQIRYSDDETPLVWMAVGEWVLDEHGRPTDGAGKTVYDAAAAVDPVRAVLRLCEQTVDGGHCIHCRRPTGFEPDSIDTMPANDLFCWYQYDPELRTFRRGCEGSST